MRHFEARNSLIQMAPKTPVARTIEVFVVIPSRVLLLDVAGPLEVLRRANFEQTDVRFVVTYVGPTQTSISSVGLTLAQIAPLSEKIPEGAMIIVPGVADTSLEYDAIAPDDGLANDEIVQWLRRSVRPGMRVVSICSGTLLLGRAGLLDGYECTTHHGTIAELVQQAPLARILENRLFVESGERLTSAGVTAGIDLMLHIVAKEAGSAAALAVARHLLVYLRRAGADPQLSPWLEGRNHIHPAVHRAQDAIAKDPSTRWTLKALASIAGTSERNLSRIFNEHAGMSITDYLNRLRVAGAHQMVTASRLSMERVAENSGFSSTRQFRRAWNRLHAIPPSRLRNEKNAP